MLKRLLINTFRHTFYSGFLLIRKMLCPGPDDHVHVVHAENLRKAPKSTVTCVNRPCKSHWLYTVVQTINKSPTFLRTFASNPLTTSVFSLLQPQMPDLFLWKCNKKYHTLHLLVGAAFTKKGKDGQDTCWWNQSTVNFLFQTNTGLSQTTFTQDKYSYCSLLS